MPRTSVLTETDGPFAQVDDRAAMPWDVDKAVKGIADIWGESAEDVQGILAENLRRLGTMPPAAISL